MSSCPVFLDTVLDTDPAVSCKQMLLDQELERPDLKALSVRRVDENQIIACVLARQPLQRIGLDQFNAVALWPFPDLLPNAIDGLARTIDQSR